MDRGKTNQETETETETLRIACGLSSGGILLWDLPLAHLYDQRRAAPLRSRPLPPCASLHDLSLAQPATPSRCAVSCLQFCPYNPRLLLQGGYDGALKVRLRYVMLSSAVLRYPASSLSQAYIHSLSLSYCHVMPYVSCVCVVCLCRVCVSCVCRAVRCWQVWDPEEDRFRPKYSRVSQTWVYVSSSSRNEWTP